jgi:hypothetical protein
LFYLLINYYFLFLLINLNKIKKNFFLLIKIEKKKKITLKKKIQFKGKFKIIISIELNKFIKIFFNYIFFLLN